jgi:nitric oxide reductase NorD protein
MNILEPEEFVGQLWHRLVGGRATLPHHPGHAVTFDSIRGALNVVFHGLGGDAAVPLAAGKARDSRHRLSWRQRLGSESEALDQPRLCGETLYLPQAVALFPEERLNRALFVWLCAFFAAGASPLPSAIEDPLQRDLAFLRAAEADSLSALRRWPGLRPIYAELCAALLASRPRRQLRPVERQVEAVIRAMLGEADAAAGPLPAVAPRHYRPFLPVPLWGWREQETLRSNSRRAEETAGAGADAADGTRRQGRRAEQDQAKREDSLILNRFEKILSLAEMLDINRSVDADDEESARKALEDSDEIRLSSHKSKPAVKLKFDLDLPPEGVDAEPLQGEATYPEWDYRRQIHHQDHCRVLCRIASEEGESWRPDAETERRIRLVRRQFEALRPRHELLRGQLDGFDLDLESLVRAKSDMRATGHGSNRIYLASRRQARDLAVALLVDVSLSTDSWIDNRRVLDVEKEALTVLAHGLEACGDDHSILTFTSCRRSWVRVETVKHFDEAMSDQVGRRIAALKPGFYTRMGAALRHAAAGLTRRPNRHKLLIVLTDGKPNDIDHYEGRYGVEDTRRAVQEARNKGIALFGVTVDKEAQDYFPVMFGHRGYAIIDHVARLPAALPSLYRHLVSV